MIKSWCYQATWLNKQAYAKNKIWFHNFIKFFKTELGQRYSSNRMRYNIKLPFQVPCFYRREGERQQCWLKAIDFPKEDKQNGKHRGKYAINGQKENSGGSITSFSTHKSMRKG